MKKILTILAAVAIVLSLSCGVLADPSPDPGPFPLAESVQIID
ncbi:hypothetical protein [Anoxybacter fermentans]|nr:hypothetical protein [Anoxybacter fermentans]